MKTVGVGEERSSVIDVVTWGETMIRLSTPQGVPLEGAQALDYAVGGTESNVAIALARLGRRVSWVSRLPANPLGRRIGRDVAAHGVDLSHVIWAGAEEKAGLYFVELGSAPRGNQVIYERRDSAIARLEPDTLDYGFLASGRVLHLTGITPALGDGCRAAWLRSAERARAAGAEVSLDLNFRAKLWSPQAAREALEAALPHVTMLFSGLRDLATVFGLATDPERAARAIASRFGVPLVVVTLAEEGALAYERDAARARRHPAFATEVEDRVGAGDAFAAGFLHGWLDGDVERGLRCANASAALKQTYRGDVSWATLADLEALIAGDAAGARGIRR